MKETLHGAADCAQIAQDYKDGLNYSQLAAKYGVARDTVKAALRRHGVDLQAKQAPPMRSEEQERLRSLLAQGISMSEVSRQLGRPRQTVANEAKALGLAAMPRVGALSPQWKGGEKRVGDRVFVFIAADDQLAKMRDANGYALKQKVLMARKLGVPLLAWERVVFKNNDKTDFNLENLEIVTDFSKLPKSEAE